MSNQKKSNKSKDKESDWQERVVQIRRVTKVVKGGKKLSFRAILVIGNEKGEVGVGVGKITLYKGREVVQRNIESDKAVDSLIDLIKQHGDWVEAQS